VVVDEGPIDQLLQYSLARQRKQGQSNWWLFTKETLWRRLTLV